MASILVFLCFGVTQAKDGPFTRPHPGKIITLVTSFLGFQRKLRVHYKTNL